jgi:hypothetical protein
MDLGERAFACGSRCAACLIAASNRAFTAALSGENARLRRRARKTSVLATTCRAKLQQDTKD